MFWRSYICHPDLKRGHLGWDLTAGIKRQSCILSELFLCLFSFENLRRYLGHIILVSFFFWKFEEISGTHLRGGIWREALGDNPPRLDQRHCPLPSISLEWADLKGKKIKLKSFLILPQLSTILSPQKMEEKFIWISLSKSNFVQEYAVPSLLPMCRCPKIRITDDGVWKYNLPKHTKVKHFWRRAVLKFWSVSYGKMAHWANFGHQQNGTSGVLFHIKPFRLILSI